jgi:hypothetical protein
MAEPIVPASLFQQALFDTIRSANVAAQGYTADSWCRPISSGSQIVNPISAPYILNHLANGNNFNV